MRPTLLLLRRWGISVASFISGVLTLFVFRRDLPGIRWIVGYLLLLWLLFALLAQMRRPLEARRQRFVVTAVDYTIQSLYHGLLLFVLPAYYASSTLLSMNVLFLALLVVMTLLATVDPWYQVLVHPRPWLGLVFLIVSIFAALNVALPLVGIPPYLALLLSAWTATVALTPIVRRGGSRSWSAALALTAVAGLGAVAVAHAARYAIPPAPLTLARATLARGVASFEPVDPITGAVSEREIRGGGLIAYTVVYAPAGLQQPVEHVWRHDGRVMNVVTLSPVRGGRRQGFRTYSRKASFPSEPAGRWTVDVMTTSGQLIGRLSFEVTR